MSLRDRTRKYWIISSSWRGRDVGEENTELRTVSQIMQGLQELGKVCLHFRLQAHVFGLLDAVIEGKRNRKRKPLDNVVRLADLSKGLAGNRATMVIIDEVHRIPETFFKSGK